MCVVQCGVQAGKGDIAEVAYVLKGREIVFRNAEWEYCFWRFR